MKHFLLACTILAPTVAIAGSPENAPVVPAVEQPTPFDWSGAYGGAFLSFEKTSVGVDDIDGLGVPPFDFSDFDASGASAGAIVGFNAQRGNAVFGIEADFGGSGTTHSHVVDTVNGDETLEWNSNKTMSLRLRAGVAKGRSLIYGTAGVARMNADLGYLNYDDAGVVIEADGRVNHDFKGYSFGVGIEHAKTDKLILRGEVLVSKFEETIVPLTSTAPFDFGYSPSSVAVRVGAIFKF